MQETLENIKAAWEGSPRNAELAVSLSDDYVAANPELYVDYEEKTTKECVEALEVFRDAGMETQMWQAQAWIFHRFEFQNIGGEAQAQVRIVPEGV